MKILHLHVCCKIIVPWCWLCFPSDCKSLFPSEEINPQFDFPADASLVQLFHVGNRSAHLLHPHLSSCAFLCLTTKTHDLYLLTRVHSDVRVNILGVSPCMAKQTKRSRFCARAPWCSRVFAVIAPFSYAAVSDLTKNVNRQAGYVSECWVSEWVSDWTKNNRTPSVTSPRTKKSSVSNRRANCSLNVWVVQVLRFQFVCVHSMQLSNTTFRILPEFVWLRVLICLLANSRTTGWILVKLWI